MELKELAIEAYYRKDADISEMLDMVKAGKCELGGIPMPADIVRIGNRIFFDSKLISGHLVDMDGGWKMVPGFSRRFSPFSGKVRCDGVEFDVEGGPEEYGNVFGIAADWNYASADRKELDNVIKVSAVKVVKAPKEINDFYKDNIIIFAEEGVGLNSFHISKEDVDALSAGEQKVPYTPYISNIISYEQLVNDIKSGKNASEIDIRGYSNLDDNDFSRDLDLSSVTGVTAQWLLEARNLSGVKIPDGVDFAGIDFAKYSCRINCIDLSKALNVNLASFVREHGFYYGRARIIMPEYLDLSGVENFKTATIRALDFSGTRNFPPEIIDWYNKEGVTLEGTVLPDNVDEREVEWERVVSYKPALNSKASKSDLAKCVKNRSSLLAERLLELCDSRENKMKIQNICADLAFYSEFLGLDRTELENFCRGKGYEKLQMSFGKCTKTTRPPMKTPVLQNMNPIPMTSLLAS